MKKSIIFNLLLLFNVFLLNINDVYAEGLSFETCQMSQAYQEWLNLSEEEQLIYTEPEYCDETKRISVLNTNLMDMFASVTGNSELPSYYSSVDQKYITPVGNQLSSGSCWAFTSNAVVESNILKNEGVTVNLSEAHIDFMSSGTQYYDDEHDMMSYNFTDNGINKYGYNRQLDGGGNRYYTSSYYFNRTGGISELTMPIYVYLNGNNGWKPITAEKLHSIDSTPVVNVLEERYKYNSAAVCSADEITRIKNWVMDYGAVGTTMYIDQAKYMATGSYYMYDLTAKDENNQVIKSVNHAVTIVGWDDTIPKEAFNNPNVTRDGGWIIKNSWGTSWGNKGYFYISYDDALVCRSTWSYSAESGNHEDYSYIANQLSANVNNKPVGLPNTTYNFYTFTEFNRQNEEEYLERVSVSVLAGQTNTVYLIDDVNDIGNFPKWKTIGHFTADADGVKTVTPTQKYKITNDKYIIAVRYNKGDSIPMVCRSTLKTSHWYNAPMTNPDDNKFAIGHLIGYQQGSNWVYKNFFDVNTDYYSSDCASSVYVYTYGNLFDIDTVDKTNDKLYLERNDSLTINFKYSNYLDYNNLEFKIFNSEEEDVTDIFSASRYYLKEKKLKVGKMNKTIPGTYNIKFYLNNNEIKDMLFDFYAVINQEKELDDKYQVVYSDYHIIVDDDTISKFSFDDLKEKFGIQSSDYDAFEVRTPNDEIVTEGFIGTNYKVKVSTFSYYITMYGDVYADGKINSQDYIKIKQQIMSDDNSVITHPNELKAADYNHDDAVTSQDYVKIKQLIMNSD